MPIFRPGQNFLTQIRKLNLWFITALKRRPSSQNNKSKVINAKRASLGSARSPFVYSFVAAVAVFVFVVDELVRNLAVLFLRLLELTQKGNFPRIVGCHAIVEVKAEAEVDQTTSHQK